MTPRKLNNILFNIDNQKMTIEQLREKLFNIDEHFDTEIDPKDRRDFTNPEYWEGKK